MSSARVLGVDTSLRSTGLGVVEAKGNQLVAIEFSTIKNAASLKHSDCLLKIKEQISACIESTQPEAAAIEGIFHFKNAKTAVTLGQARGVAIAVCADFGIPVYEYAPRRVKQAVVGHGAAHKQQVVKMVQKILSLADEPKEDEADALALAVCHLHSRTLHEQLQPKVI